MRPADLPLVKMYPVILIAALTRGSKVCFRVAKGDDGVGHNGLRQTEELLLGLYPVHLGPGAQPDCAKPQLLCSKADVLGGNGSADTKNAPALRIAERVRFVIFLPGHGLFSQCGDHSSASAFAVSRKARILSTWICATARPVS